MANIKSAIKRAEVAEERRRQNQSVKSMVKTSVRKFEEALASGDSAQAEDKLRAASRTIDKAASKGVLHKNTAARKKAKLARRLHAKNG